MGYIRLGIEVIRIINNYGSHVSFSFDNFSSNFRLKSAHDTRRTIQLQFIPLQDH